MLTKYRTYSISLIKSSLHDVIPIYDQAVKSEEAKCLLCNMKKKWSRTRISHQWKDSWLSGTHLTSPRIRINDKLPVQDRTSKSHSRILMVREEETIDQTVAVMAVNLFGYMYMCKRKIREHSG